MNGRIIALYVMFATGMFESTTQRKILRVLAERNRRYTIEELAELCNRSEASVSRALRQVHRYDFIEKDRVRGSKQLTFRLDPASRYAAAINEFFSVERERERQNGTIPVDVWNLLEETTNRFESKFDAFEELFLFGSYATGDYYAASDIDLILAHSSDTDVTSTVDQVITDVGDERLHVIAVEVNGRARERDAVDILDAIHSQTPVTGTDILVPLSGEVTL